MADRYDESILRSFRAITHAIDLYNRRLASQYHLTGPQLVCLRTLARSGPLTPGLLAAEVALSQATVTGILDRLEVANLIRRQRASDDRRRVLLELTAQGRRVASSAPHPLPAWFSRRLLELPLAEQARIDAVLRKVVEMMREEEERPRSFATESGFPTGRQD